MTHAAIADAHSAVSEVQRDVADTHITVVDTHTVVADTHTVVTEVQRDVADTHIIVSDIRRQMLGSQGGTDDQCPRSVSDARTLPPSNTRSLLPRISQGQRPQLAMDFSSDFFHLAFLVNPLHQRRGPVLAVTS